MSRVIYQMRRGPLHARERHARQQCRTLCSLYDYPVARIDGTYGTAWAYGLARLYERQLDIRTRLRCREKIIVFGRGGGTIVAKLAGGMWKFQPSHWEAGSIPPVVLAEVATYARRLDPDARSAPMCHAIAEAFRAFLRSLRGPDADRQFPRALERLLYA